MLLLFRSVVLLRIFFYLFRNRAELFVSVADKQMNKQASKLPVRVMRDSVSCHHTHKICMSGIVKLVGSCKPSTLVWWASFTGLRSTATRPTCNMRFRLPPFSCSLFLQLEVWFVRAAPRSNVDLLLQQANFHDTQSDGTFYCSNAAVFVHFV